LPRLQSTPNKMVVTQAFVTLQSELNTITTWISFTHSMAKDIDKRAKIAARALSTSELIGPEELARYKNILDEKTGTAEKAFNRYRQFNRKVVFVLAVDAFLRYLSDLLKVIHHDFPAILKTDDKIAFKEIVNFDRMNDLTDFLIERRITDLAFKSFGDLQKELRDRTGFDISPKPYRRNKISDLIEMRNLFVHAGGVVGHRYIRRVRKSTERIGDVLDVQDPVRYIFYLRIVAAEIDSRAIQKFKIRKRSLVRGSLSNG
jgi:hypothetical protein